MEFSTCPSCGLPTLEAIDREADDFLAPANSQSITMFECVSCHWIGNTSTVNLA